jgi:hypothetical protein
VPGDRAGAPAAAHAQTAGAAVACHVDPLRSAPLEDVGGDADYITAVCVTADGDTVLWLVSASHLACPPDSPCRANTGYPAHEKLGQLPVWVRDRIWGDALRCGRPTRAGRPCQIRVGTPGGPCGMHAKPRCGGCGQLMHNQGGVWGCYGCHQNRWAAAQVQP